MTASPIRAGTVAPDFTLPATRLSLDTTRMGAERYDQSRDLEPLLDALHRVAK